MSPRQVKARATVIVGVIAEIIWRAFGLAWYVVPTGMGIGSIPALHTDWLTGGIIAYGSTLTIAARDMGREIAMSGNLSMADVTRAFKKAVAQQEQAEAAQADKGKKS